MAAPASTGYSPDWVEEAGLDLGGMHCITLVRGLDPREALRRFAISDTDIRLATWAEFQAQLAGTENNHHYSITAAFTLGDCVALVEWPGIRGITEPGEAVSLGTEAVTVYSDIADGTERLWIARDGKPQVSIESDDPVVITGGDAEQAGRLLELVYDAFTPYPQDEPPLSGITDGRVDLKNGEVDLLRVACGYLGLQPTAADVSRPVPGAIARGWPPF